MQIGLQTLRAWCIKEAEASRVQWMNYLAALELVVQSGSAVGPEGGKTSLY